MSVSLRSKPTPIATQMLLPCNCKQDEVTLKSLQWVGSYSTHFESLKSVIWISSSPNLTHQVSTSTAILFLKSLEWRNRGPVDAVQSTVGRWADTLQRDEVDWSGPSGPGLYFRLFCQRGLNSVNTSQSVLQGDRAWIYEALIHALEMTFWPKHEAYKTTPQC